MKQRIEDWLRERRITPDTDLSDEHPKTDETTRQADKFSRSASTKEQYEQRIEVSPEMQELAGTIRELLSRQGEQLADLGMLSRDSLERFKDTYLPRLYRQRTELFGGNDLAKMNREFNKAMLGSLGNALGGQHLKGRGIFKTVSRSEQADYEAKGYELRQDFGNQGKHAGKVLMWRDYTREERTQMGEERDAILRFTQGYVQTQADLAKGVLFQRIAQNEERQRLPEREKGNEMTELAWIAEARAYIGMHERDARGLKTIPLWVRALKGWWSDTKTPWCGTFVGHCLQAAGRDIAKE